MSCFECHGKVKRGIPGKMQCQHLARYLVVFCPIRQEEESKRQKKNSDKIFCWEEEFRGTAEETQDSPKEEKGEKDESKITCEFLPVSASAIFQLCVKAL